VWFDSLGRRLNTASAPGDFNSLCMSADGKRVVFDATDSETGAVDIWSMDLPSGTPKRLTHDPAVDFYVACAPSGDDVVFSSLRRGFPSLYHLKTSRPGDERPLLQTAAAILPTDWSADGQWIVYSTFGEKTSSDLWVVPRDGGEPKPFLVTEAEERNGRLSPDGRWMAYTSSTDTVGGSEIFVKPFPATGSRTRWQVSSGGGRQPVWDPGGRALFYVSPDQKIVSSEVDGSGSVFVAGNSRTFGETRVAIWDRANQGSAFAITPAGDRLLVSNATTVTRPITVVLNWPAMLGTN
jgi:Tol biopolymer transport system component